jgi:FKBP-type peptidyl-prolyl cis-trans isomerase
MRRTLLTVIVVLAACGGGEEADDSSGGEQVAESSIPRATATTAPAAPTSTQPASPTSTRPAAPVESDDCEDEPDPADYVGGAPPPAIRPCAVPTALQIHTVRSGNGRNAQDGDTVIVDYVGIRSEDGTIFDESYSRGVPLDFPLGRGGVIQGWDDGLIGTQAGSVVKLDIPAELAYGENPPPGEIEAGDALTFVIEVRSVIAPVAPTDAPLDIDIAPSVDATAVTVTEVIPGDGEVVELGDTVVAHLLIVRGDNQVVLVNTWEEADPLQIIMGEGQTIPGLFEGLQGARVGSTVAIAMPPAQAFGEQGEPTLGLPAGVDVIAVVEIVGAY